MRVSSFAFLLGATALSAAPAPKTIYVVSGHDDSRVSDPMNATADAPGANDDASGVAAVLEMARVMSRQKWDATLLFMAVAPLWQHTAIAGNVMRFTVPKVSKDNFLFGVAAVDQDGNRSCAVYPAPSAQ